MSESCHECKCNNCPNRGLKLDHKKICVHPGNIVILERFSTVKWRVHFGWFSYDGNRKICGWYLQQILYPHTIKPLQETDLYDIYVLEC